MVNTTNLKNLISTIPKNENIFLHCRLKGMEGSKKNYSLLCKKIIKLLYDRKPKSIIIPTYTYSFTKNFVFNQNLSASETGRFSEEIRKTADSSLRTLDPIFSHVILQNSNFLEEKISTRSFGNRTIFHKFVQDKGVIVNLNLEDITTPLFHFLEYKFNVPYRKNRIFCGDIVKKNKSKIKIKYNFFCRKKNSLITIDRKKILKDLKKNNIVFEKKSKKNILRWFYSDKLIKFLSKKLKNNPNYLIKIN
jgi:aminoglycoside 3-N-acetyltransferase